MTATTTVGAAPPRTRGWLRSRWRRWLVVAAATVVVVLVAHQAFLLGTARPVPVEYFARFDCSHIPLVFTARDAAGDIAGQVVAQGKVGPPKGRYCTVETVLPVHGSGPLHYTVALATTPERIQDLGTYSVDQRPENGDFAVGEHRNELGPPGTTFLCPYPDPSACTAEVAAGP